MSQSSRDIADSSSSELESLSAVVVLGLNFRYGFRGCWLTLRVVLQSLHHRSTAESGLKWLRGGPSVVISRRSSTVETWRDVLLSVLMTFRLEKKRSTLPFENGKLKSSSHISRIFGHFAASGAE